MSVAARNSARIPSFGRTGVRGVRVADRERLLIPCHFLCLECGLLVEQKAGAGYRQAPESDALAACRECGGQAWADLREESVVERLKVADEALPSDPQRVRRFFAVTVLGSIAVVLSLLAVVGAFLFVSLFGFGYMGAVLTKNLAGWAFLGAFLSIFGPYLVVANVLPALRRRLQSRRSFPMRWSARSAKGAALVAPLSGRACRSYEVAVRKTDQPRAHAGTWLLVDRHGPPVTTGRERVELDTESSVVKQYLRRRGLDPVGLNLVAYETIAA